MMAPLVTDVLGLTRSGEWKSFFWVFGTLALISYSSFIIQERYRLYGVPMWLVSFYFGMRNKYRMQIFLTSCIFISVVGVIYVWLKG